MKKLATINIYIGENLPHGSSARPTNAAWTEWDVQIDRAEELEETSKRGIKTTARERFEGSLVHELGHIVQHLVEEEPRDQLAVEQRAWDLGAQMGHVNPEVARAAVGSYKD